jgi:pyruvate,orthophosphate dikinase
MQDTEFTVEQGSLFMLQTSAAKRPAQAAVRFAVDAVEEGLLDKAGALQTIDAERLDALLHDSFARDADFEVLVRGVPASPGAAKGEIVFTADDAVAAGEDGRKVILVRPFTKADDVAGFGPATGILTSRGGKASHAALVARGMGKPCVAGAGDLEVDLKKKVARVGDTELHEGDTIAIDGTTGVVTADDVPLEEPEMTDAFETVLGWADELRSLGIRANADTPDDATRAREFGAEGIGLCRSEHIFLGTEHQERMQAMIMAETDEDRDKALDDLLSLQEEHFAALFEAMQDLPVTIRLLDPPLHEFIPDAEELAREVERAEAEESDDLDELKQTLDRVHELAETNPMLGTRGVRLGVLQPDVYEMQMRAIVRAAIAERKRSGDPPQLEVMVPLVAYEQELEQMRGLLERIASEEGGDDLDISIGTMIELPRACFVADRIAEHADFFSFGTNDLTQTALGFSRDDVGGMLARYLELKIVERSPFETIDKPGVGWLVRLAAWVGREAKPDLKLGICGEHGGDPESIAFFQIAGLDYVSCSPFRVPIARVAAAQAALADE